jgi:hypothetical protein
MKKKQRSIALALLLGTSTLPQLVGCGGSPATDQQSAQSTLSPSAAGSNVQTLVVDDPTFQPKIVESTDSAPQRSVAVFLDSIRRGDESTANSMLTPLAREEVSKTQFVIGRIGTPQGTFKIGRLGFPYPDQTIALVECQWSEPATASEAEMQMDIVCEVRQEQEGWRIAGMAVTAVGEEEPLVIDFEDRNRLQQLGQMANGGSSPTTTQAQPGQQGTLQQASFGTPVPTNELPGQLPASQPQQQPQQYQLPPLPAFPSQGDNKIATPPGGNVLR